MFDLLSDDVIRRIYQHLEVKERGRLASVNRSFRRLFHTWDDVLYCSARYDGVSLAGDKFIFEVQKSEQNCILDEPFLCGLKRCPWIRKLAIHDVRVLRNVDSALMRNLVNVDELHIPSKLFSNCASYNELINALFSLPRLRVIHIQQRYCEEKTHLNVFDSDHAQSIVSTNVSSVKLQGVTVTSGAIEMLSFKYAKTVNTLCLIGSLMHTPDMYVYFNALNRFDKLVSLTIPPSLYSISTTNKTLFAGNYPSLKDLYLLRSMAVFVSRPDFDELKRFINAVLPPTLEHLVLFDETCRLELNVEDELKDRKPRIHFCDDDEIIVDSFWMNDRSELLTKSLWKSPYKPYAVLQPNLPEWYCTLSELMETACSADEVVDREASLVSTQANVIDSATVETDVVTIGVMQRHGAITNTANKTNLHTARELSTALEHSHPFDQLSTARSESTAISTTTSEDSNSSSSTM
ncbi:hypothetical protein Tcan_12943 [Toxocara canis]|uniref:F-box domain-containing protein n=1 Tax=Toxocara canis TaxID=6265 RepID=A0A0B2VLX1_TOXCA|nr:hypothetical protein Tcan_12943 [Toxocara canis]